MGLKEQLEKDLKESMRNRDRIRLDTIRAIKTAIKNKEVELIKELDDTAIIGMINTLIKQHQESIEYFKKAKREDLVRKEEMEMEILRSYLPEPLSSEELESIIMDAIRESHASGPRDIGKVMKIVMPKIAGRADGKVVNEMVRRKLSGEGD